MLFRHRVWVVLFLSALVIRLAFVSTRTNDLAWPDERDYQSIARNLVERGVYAEADGRRASRSPGYPVFLAGLDRIGVRSPCAVYGIQALLDALTCVLAAALARRLLDDRAGRWAGWMAAFYPFFVYFVGTLLSETLFTLGLVSFILLLELAFEERPRSGWTRTGLLVSAGVAAGLAIHVRGSFLLFPFFVLPFLLIRFRPRLRTLGRWALMTVVMLLVLMPWALRNRRLFGHLVPTTLQVGESLYEANSPTADGGPAMDRIDWDGVSGGAMGEYERNEFFRDEALRWIRGNPGRFLRLAVVKVVRFWNVIPNHMPYRSVFYSAVSVAAQVPLLLLAFVGLFIERGRRKGVWLLLAPVIYFTGMHAVFVGSVRYRTPVMAFVIVLAGAGAATLWLLFMRRRGVGRRRWWRMGAIALVVASAAAGGGVWAFNRYTDPERVRATAEAHLREWSGGPAQVNDAVFSLRRGIVLHTVRLRAAGRAEERPDLEVARARLLPRWGALMTGGSFWGTVELEDAEVNVRLDADMGWPYLEQVRRAAAKRVVAHEDVPRVFVRRARLQVAGLRTPMGALPAMALSGLHAEVRQLSRAGEVEARVWSDDRGLGRPSATVRIAPDAHSVAGGVALGGLIVDERWREFLPEGLKARWDEFSPIRGRVDGAVEFRWQADHGRTVEFRGDLRVQEGAFRHRVLPDPVHDLFAEAHIEGGSVRVREFRAWVGDMRVSGSGRGALSPKGGLTGELTLRADRVPLDVRWTKGVPSEVREYWDRLRPSGTVNVAAHVTRSSAESAPDLWLRAALLDCSLTPEGIPTPITNLRGTVEYARSRLSLVDVAGRFGDAQIRVYDSFFGMEKGGALRAGVELTGLKPRGEVKTVLGPRLSAMLPETIRERVDSLRLDDGTLNVLVTLDRAQQLGALAWRVQCDFAEVGLTLPSLPVPVTRLSGSIVATPDEIQTTALSGRWGEARFEAPDTRIPLATDAAKEIRFALRAVPLTEPFYSVSPLVKEAMDDFDLTGHCDLEITFRRAEGPDRAFEPNVVARLDGARFMYKQFAYPLDKATGELEFDAGTFKIGRIQGVNKSAQVSLEIGSEPFEGNPGRRVSIRARDGALDGDLRGALGAEEQALWDLLKPEGNVDVVYVRRFQRRPWRPELFHVVSDLEFKTLTLDLGAPVTFSGGHVKVANCRAQADGSLVASGALQMDRAEFKGMEATNLRATFESDARSLRLRDVTAEFYGGRAASPEVVIPWSNADATAGGPVFRGVVRLTDVDAARLAAAHGIKQVSGRLDAGGAFTGRLAGKPSLEARGALAIHEGEIARLPALLSLLNFLQLHGISAPAFHTLELAYVFKDGRFRARELNLRGPVLSLYGEGVVGEDGALRFRFVPEFLGQSRLPGIGKLLAALNETLIPIRLEGDGGNVAWKVGAPLRSNRGTGIVPRLFDAAWRLLTPWSSPDAPEEALGDRPNNP